MSNILDIAPKEQKQLTTEYSVVDSIIADYEYEQVIEEYNQLTREMAIAEQANIAIYDYENGLTTENSQSKLTKLYTDLNLREDQLEELTTESASDIIEKIKAMIERIWDKFIRLVKRITKAVLHKVNADIVAIDKMVSDIDDYVNSNNIDMLSKPELSNETIKDIDNMLSMYTDKSSKVFLSLLSAINPYYSDITDKFKEYLRTTLITKKPLKNEFNFGYVLGDSVTFVDELGDLKIKHFGTEYKVIDSCLLPRLLGSNINAYILGYTPIGLANDAYGTSVNSYEIHEKSLTYKNTTSFNPLEMGVVIGLLKELKTSLKKLQKVDFNKIITKTAFTDKDITSLHKDIHNNLKVGSDNDTITFDEYSGRMVTNITQVHNKFLDLLVKRHMHSYEIANFIKVVMVKHIKASTETK